MQGRVLAAAQDRKKIHATVRTLDVATGSLTVGILGEKEPKAFSLLKRDVPVTDPLGRTLKVEDLVTGTSGTIRNFAVQLVTALAPCVANTTTLCLNSGRFQTSVAWQVPTQGTSGVGTAMPLTTDTGEFWFFSANNIELVVKVVAIKRTRTPRSSWPEDGGGASLSTPMTRRLSVMPYTIERPIR